MIRGSTKQDTRMRRARILKAIAAESDDMRQLRQEIRARAERFLSKAAGGSTKKLIVIVLDRQQPVRKRREACWAVGDLKLREGLSVLLEVLTEPDLHLPWIAANALHRLPNRKRASRRLMRIIEVSKDPNVRQAAIYALGWVNDPHSSDLLVSIVGDATEQPHTRSLAIQSLQFLNGSERISNSATLRSLIVSAMQDSSPEIRYAALCVVTGRDRQHPAVRKMLEKLSHDRVRVPGIGRVGELAQSILRETTTRRRRAARPPARSRGTATPTWSTTR